MGKFRKLLWSNRYLIKIPKTVLLKNKAFEGYDIKVDGEQIVLYTSKQELGKINNLNLPNEDITIIDRYHRFIKERVLKHLVGLISFGLIILILASSNFLIREIVFEDEQMYSPDVYQTVRAHLKKWGPFNVLDDDISEISKELRQKYYHYAWIGLSKTGSKLVIEIERQDVPSIPGTDQTVGDLVASSDAIIKAIYVKTGIVTVSINQSVKKGDVIVTGNLRYFNNETALENWIRASGAIIARTLTYEQITIQKMQTRVDYTGRVEEKIEVHLFNRPTTKTNSSFTNYHRRIESSYKIGTLFKISKIIYYEKSNIITVYDEEMIDDYVNNYIINQFESKRTHPKEQITFKQIVEISEDPHFFRIKVVIGADKNIATFKPVH